MADMAEGREACGMAIVGTSRRPHSLEEVPTRVDLYVTEGVWELTREGFSGRWGAEFRPHAMGRPRIVALVFEPDTAKPFGHTRISRSVRADVDEVMRLNLQLAVASEVSAIPQKALLGVTDSQWADIMEKGWDYAVGHVLALSKEDPADPSPAFVQSQQITMSPLLEVKRSIAADFCSTTSVPISELNLNDTVYTSKDSLMAAKDNLVGLCESLNAANGRTLATIARMCMAIDDDVPLDGISDEQAGVMAHFLDPSTPSMASVADSTLKTAQAIEGYGQTSVCLERLGFDESERARIQGEIRRAQARAGATAVLARNLGATQAEAEDENQRG